MTTSTREVDPEAACAAIAADPADIDGTLFCADLDLSGSHRGHFEVLSPDE